MTTADPREVTPVKHGTGLRDGAVTPLEGDFLPPTNAGKPGEKGNPHGPHVVAPGIHASQHVRPVRPGPVSPDAATQSREETEHLAAHIPSAAPQVAEEEGPDGP